MRGVSKRLKPPPILPPIGEGRHAEREAFIDLVNKVIAVVKKRHSRM